MTKTEPSPTCAEVLLILLGLFFCIWRFQPDDPPNLTEMLAFCPAEPRSAIHAALKKQYAVFAAEMDDVRAKLEQTTAAKAQFQKTSKAELDDVKAKLEQTTAAKARLEQTSAAELDYAMTKLKHTIAEKAQFQKTSKAELDDVRAKLEQTTAAKAQFQKTSKAELDDVKAKLEHTIAAKAQFQQTSKAELEDVRAKLEQTTAAKAQFEQISKAELDDVRTKLQQTTAAKAQLEQQLEDFQAKFDRTLPASLAAELAQWYACLPFGTGMLVAIALVSHFVEMIAKLVNDRGGDGFGCYFCILST